MPLSNRMARAIIDRYPAVWRQRYADEMLALIDAQTLRWRDVADLARRCLIERSRSLFEPADHPNVALLLAGGTSAGLFLLTGLVFAIAAWWIGRALAGAYGPAQDWLLIPALLLVCASWFRHIRLISRRAKDAQEPGIKVPRPAEPFRRALAWNVALFAGVVILQWGISSDDWTPAWWSSWWQVWMFALQFDRVWPSNGLPEALSQRAGALESMKWARMELTRCETLAAEGRISDELTRAQAEVQRIQTMYDDAMRVLHGMGYRATFQ